MVTDWHMYIPLETTVLQTGACQTSQADTEIIKALKPVRELSPEPKMSGTVLTLCCQLSAGGKSVWVSAATSPDVFPAPERLMRSWLGAVCAECPSYTARGGLCFSRHCGKDLGDCPYSENFPIISAVGLCSQINHSCSPQLSSRGPKPISDQGQRFFCVSENFHVAWQVGLTGHHKQTVSGQAPLKFPFWADKLNDALHQVFWGFLFEISSK